jgi:hypothetical protein
MEGQTKSGSDLYQGISWLHIELPKPFKEAPKSHKMWWLFCHRGAGLLFFETVGAKFLSCFQVERRSGSDGLSAQEKCKRRTKKGRAYTELKQQSAMRGSSLLMCVACVGCCT